MTHLDLPRSAFAQTPDALSREWLVTNGLGGFAAGTVAQANTRRYHALLVAAVRPPVERIVVVAKVDATVQYGDRRFELGANEFADGTVSPRGFEQLNAFHLEGTLPVWTYAIADAVLEQRIWMVYGRNTVYLSFTLRAAAQPMDLELVPLCTYRDYHAHTQGGWPLSVAAEERGCRVSAYEGARPYRLSIDRGEFENQPDWYWRFHHRAEAERGLDTSEDLFRPGTFRARLAPGETVSLVASTEEGRFEPAAAALDRELLRQRSLVEDVPVSAPAWIPQLRLAADQFIVQRHSAGAPAGTTVIAGYPWFSDWGRDTMIALPGLTLATRRTADAAAILRTFAAHTSEGMLPNRFPDGGETPEYNTVDATLWYFHAIACYFEATGDAQLIRDLYPVLRDIVEWHRRGTRFGIQMDANDGLLRAGEPGVQLTWMDAKIGNWVVTPRIGKPVEINALWHYALVSMAQWAPLAGDKYGAADYGRGARQIAASFGEAFWNAAGNYLYDVVDGSDGELDARGRRVDATLRPNQIFAVSLGSELLDAPRSRAVVDACARELLTPVGLRSLSPRHAQYTGQYRGGPRERDAVYHQGTVWSWLLGPFALAHYKVYGNAVHALQLLSGLAPHLQDECLGTISEIFDGDAPHAPRGCFAQAWSVSETLRAWQTLTAAQSQAKTKRLRSAT